MPAVDLGPVDLRALARLMAARSFMAKKYQGRGRREVVDLWMLLQAWKIEVRNSWDRVWGDILMIGFRRGPEPVRTWLAR